ncbi:KilA-N domain-containing protein [Roseomonas sp. BN140053]|uniref:KilA-N domain-containing protein n=1 Tax=Roseomonas sp. BN140053 TaxID=3391898 RepID=UPI0039EB70D6
MSRRPADWLALEETEHFRSHADTQLAENADLFGSNAGLAGIWHLDTDGLTATVRGNQGGTWAHWQLALSYGRYLSPPFHLWCNTVVRAAMEQPEAALLSDRGVRKADLRLACLWLAEWPSARGPTKLSTAWP